MKKKRDCCFGRGIDVLLDETKIILDLCGGTGSWSKPYKDAGYDVRLVTLPDQDVRVYIPPKNVYGILAAPPCTEFSIAGAWKQVNEDMFLHALSIVDACFRIILVSRPVFWVVENPVGFLRQYLGKPRWKFCRWEYGDKFSKPTLLWGDFNIPIRHPIPFERGDMTDKIRSPVERARTSPCFAQAFFEANR